MESDVDSMRSLTPISEHYGKCATCSRNGWIKVFKDWSFHETCGHIDDWGKTVDLSCIKRTAVSRSALESTVKHTVKAMLPDMKSKAKSAGSSPPTKDIPLRKSVHLNKHRSSTITTLPISIAPPVPNTTDNEIIIAYKKLLEENKMLKEQVEKNSASAVPVIEKVIPEEVIEKVIAEDGAATVICSSTYDCNEIATISNSEGFWFCAKHFKLLLPERKHCNLFDACHNSDLIEVRPGLFGCSIHRSQYGFM